MPVFLTRWLLSAAALAVAAGLLGEHMDIGEGGDTTTDRLVALAVVALVFTIINTFVAPVVKALSLPFIIITLGFALLIINALLLLLTEWVTDQLGLAHFFVDGFWWALLGSVVISVVNAVLATFTRS